MTSSNHHWKHIGLLLTASSLFFLRVSYATPRGATTSIASREKREATEMLFNISDFTTGVVATEKKQRFCLNRLRDALRIVCSGSGRTPLYFNPNDFLFFNHSGVISKGNTRNLRNDIPAMAQQPPRRKLRKRSRRNIVRECCDTPCTYSNLRKYCSPSARLPAGQHDNKPTLFETTSGYGFSPQQQCVSVTDLQNYYLKFFHKQWKKDDHQVNIKEHESETPIEWTDASSSSPPPPYSSDAFSKFSRKQSKESSLSNPISEAELRGINEINENAETERAASHVDQSRNIYTLPPITRLINLPRGTNDYMY